jgi:hypothetical protein
MSFDSGRDCDNHHDGRVSHDDDAKPDPARRCSRRLARLALSLFLAGSFTPYATAAEPPDILWSRQIGTSTHDYSRGVAVDVAGNAYITGGTWGSLGGTNAGYDDAFLTRYDANGNLAWSRQIGTSGWDYSTGVAVDAAGNAYITGRTQGSLGGTNAGEGDAFLVKFEADTTLGKPVATEMEFIDGRLELNTVKTYQPPTPPQIDSGKKPEKTTVVLAFGHESDFGLYLPGEDKNWIESKLTKDPRPLTSTDISHQGKIFTDQEKAQIKDGLEHIFDRAYLDNIEFIIGSPRDDAINVFFTSDDRVGDQGPEGQAYAINEFNYRDPDQNEPINSVIVFNARPDGTHWGILGDRDFVSSENSTIFVAAHEIGHSLGLHHTEDYALADIDSSTYASLMYKNDQQDLMQRLVDYEAAFSNAPENAAHRVGTHNAVYNLNRYVDGDSPEELALLGLTGGSLDESYASVIPSHILEELEFSYSYSDPTYEEDLRLYDVEFIVNGEKSSEIVGVIESVYLSELNDLKFLTTTEGVPAFRAKTASDGEYDVYSYITHNGELLFTPDSEMIAGQHVTFGIAVFENDQWSDLLSGTLQTAAVPEPSALLVILGISLPLAMRRGRAA